MFNNYSNYPDGAANDPSAPFNQKAPKMQECENCGGSGKIEESCDYCECHCMGEPGCVRCSGKCTCGGEETKCDKCDGAGEVEDEQD